MRTGIASLAMLVLLGLTGIACTSPAEPLGEPDPHEGANDRYILLQKQYTFDAGLQGQRYRVVEGACGYVVGKQKMGVDFDSAFSLYEAQKVEKLRSGCPNIPCYDVAVEPHVLKVVDEDNSAPETDFYAMWVINRETGILVGTVNDVLTSEGNLFTIQWCPD